MIKAATQRAIGGGSPTLLLQMDRDPSLGGWIAIPSAQFLWIECYRAVTVRFSVTVCVICRPLVEVAVTRYG